MQVRSLLTSPLLLLATGLPFAAGAHNYLREIEAPAGYVQDVAMRVPHGCKGSPVKQVRVKIPKDVYRVTVEYRDDWDVEVKMRKVDPPVPGDGGRPITETVDEIIWRNPANLLPPDRVGEFRFRAKLPDEVGRILFFRTLNACEEGDDNYIDLPEMALNLSDPAFHEKFWSFMTATATPAPYVILTKPVRPQYPWEWENLADRAHVMPDSAGALAAD
jgi:uncharacterized protein YcnI